MKMHKTILTMLAAMLAIIGTTATVVHAEGPTGRLPNRRGWWRSSSRIRRRSGYSPRLQMHRRHSN